MGSDPVNPDHYKKGNLQVIDIIELFELNFHLGNVTKYVLRAPNKNGLEDLKKAQWYLNREIDRQTFIEDNQIIP